MKLLWRTRRATLVLIRPFRFVQIAHGAATLPTCSSRQWAVFLGRRKEAVPPERAACKRDARDRVVFNAHRHWALHVLTMGVAAMQPRMLIVDDDAEMREALGILFSREGHSCELAADAATALELVHHRTFDVVVSDVIMDGMDGLELLDRIKLSHPALPVVIITGAGRVPQAVDAIKRGAFGYAVKPCDANELQRIVASALDAREHPSESVRAAPAARDSVGELDLVGHGPAMRKLQTSIDF